MRYEFHQDKFDALAPDQRRKALRLLRDMQEGHRSNPLWRFDPMDPDGTGIPHWKQHRWLKTLKANGKWVKVRLFLGGNRSGKTTSGIVSDIIECCDLDHLPPHLHQYKRWNEPVDIWVVSVTATVMETVTLAKFKEWCPRQALVGGRWDRAYSKDLKRLHFKNGSTVQFMTQGMDEAAFKGARLHRVHFDEEPLYDHGRTLFSEALARVIDTNGDVLVTMTPQDGMTWIFDDLYAPWESQVDGAEEGVAWIGPVPIFLSVVDQDENPTLDEEGKEASLALASSDEEREARKRGRFVSFSGLVYPDFSPDRHIVPDSVVRDALASRELMICGLDPGFRHMAAAVWAFMDRDEHVWVVAEVAMQEVIIPEVAKAILGTAEELGAVPDAYIADPAILKRDPQTGLSDQQAFAVAGVAAAAGQNDVRPGINRIRHLLRQDRLHIAASCDELAREFKRYRWVQPKRSEHAPREAPVKRDDHALDALRYALMAMPLETPTDEPDTRSKVQRLLDAERSRMGRPASEYHRVG